MKSTAAVLTNINKPLEIIELDLPKLQAGQALIRLSYTGFCHTQLNEIRGLKGPDRFLPHTLGHEGAGVVMDVGSAVKKVKPGDHVVATWIKGTGCDVPSMQYHSKMGAVNSGAISTFLTHAIISENRLVKIPKEVSLREACLFGCALPTGAGVIHHEMGLQPAQSLAIFGAGGIGLSALIVAKLNQANPLIVVDIHEEKLKRSKNFGATHLINAKECDPAQRILEITDGKGVDFSLEAAGVRDAMEKAFSCLKAPMGLCVLAGNLPQHVKISIDPFDLIRGKRIRGTWGGNSVVDRDIPALAELYQQNKLPLVDLITHEVPLDQINELVNELEAGKVGRGIISLTAA